MITNKYILLFLNVINWSLVNTILGTVFTTLSIVYVTMKIIDKLKDDKKTKKEEKKEGDGLWIMGDGFAVISD